MGHSSINGTFIAENAPLLKLLALQQAVDNPVLRNLSSLTRFTHHAPDLNSLVIQDLPNLEVADLSPISFFGTLKLDNLPRLATFLVAEAPATVTVDLTIRNVGLSSLSVSNLLSADNGGPFAAVVEGIPKADNISLGFLQRESVSNYRGWKPDGIFQLRYMRHDRKSLEAQRVSVHKLLPCP